MDEKSANVATIVGDAEVEHAINTLVLAFDADPVARRMGATDVEITKS
jgi:hypothetical protein